MSDRLVGADFPAPEQYCKMLSNTNERNQSNTEAVKSRSERTESPHIAHIGCL